MLIHLITYLTIWINLCDTIENNTSKIQTKLQKLPLQYIWTNDSQDLFVKELQTDEVKQKLDEFLSNNFEIIKMMSKNVLMNFKTYCYMHPKHPLK